MSLLRQSIAKQYKTQTQFPCFPRPQMTGRTYRFPCGRWLGKGVDDGAVERLLVAEHVPPTTDHGELVEKCRTPPRCRSPSMPRKANEPSEYRRVSIFFRLR